MGCEEIQDLLSLYAGGECPDGQTEAVEAHVALCGPCARELDLYREARSALAALSEATAPAGLGRAIWSGVRGELFPRAARPRPAWFDEVLRYAAVLLLGLGSGVLIHVLRGPAEAVEETLGAKRVSTWVDVRPVSPLPPAPRLTLPAPRREAAGHFYLPRVEAFPADGAKDF